VINILDSETINKIAAGEVVERPSSVVKELVENAIDAGSTAVTIEIKDGGITFIRITDNGCGISRDDIPKAFLRHATSKIKSVEDLLSVSSLGFRGEALSSIAAVSQVEMITKTADDVSGYRYTCDGGEEKSLDEIGAPEGTTIIVRNLFYNTPVRRKFLKTAATEAGYVSSLVEHLALSHPDISFRFINNNQNKLHTSGNMNLKDIIYGVYGRDTANSLIEIDGRTQDIKMSGFIGRPVIVRGNRSYENYYINGRYIKSSIITKAIEDAYKGFIMSHNYPFTAIHFAIEPDIIDVNVHPQKMELRFSKNNYVYDFVYATIVSALKNMDLAVAVKLEDEKPHYEVNKIISPVKETKQQENLIPAPNEKKREERLPEPFEVKRSQQMIAEDSYKYEAAKSESRQMGLFTDSFLNENSKDKYRVIGQLFETYWLVEFEDKFYMMDQHAAHEKVIYERLVKKIRESEADTQMILPPVMVELNMKEQQVLEDNIDVFKKIGFELENFGGKTYKITGVPANLPNIDYMQMFTELIDNMAEESSFGFELLAERVATMSCKAAIKGNNKISYEEAKELIYELSQAENPFNCPHGRPTLIVMTKYEIERKFKRIV
jgi:DNA mismatch repair protein MutL